MRIGIIDAHILGSHLTVSDLKKYYISFDKLYVVHLIDFEIFFKNRDCPVHGDIIKELKFLREKGYLLSIEEEFSSLCDLVGCKREEAEKSFIEEYGEPEPARGFLDITCFDPFGEIPGHIPFYCARHYCHLLNFTKVHSAIPVIPFVNSKSNQNPKGLQDSPVLDIVINRLPVPDTSTSWRKLEEFKNDSDTKYKFEKLQFWMRRVANGDLCPKEIEDQLEEKLLDYKRHMELYKIETRRENFHGIFISIVDVIQNLICLKPKLDNIAGAAFSLSNRNIKIMREEMKAPGAEVAYISKAQDAIRPHKC